MLGMRTYNIELGENMNEAFWQRKPLSPALNYDLTDLLSHLYDPDPVYSVRALLGPALTAGLSISYLQPTSVIPPTMMLTSSWGVTILVGGTSGQAHLIELLQGWNNAMIGPDVDGGASGGFAHAARVIVDTFGAPDIVQASNVYLVGHSYGGAVCQALASLLMNAFASIRGIWSYGSPRPGTTVLQGRIATLQHHRWYCDDDPVRWVPPHTDEVSLVGLFGNSSLAIGCNRQVQTATGYSLSGLGETVADPGEPTVLHAVGLSILTWVTGGNGFGSVNHALPEYKRRFQQALPIKPDGPSVPRTQAEESPGTLRPREVEMQQEASVPLVESQLANPASAISQEVRSYPDHVPNVRYKRRRAGPIWVVKYGDLTVDVGPGKRAAGRKARDRNKADKVS